MAAISTWFSPGRWSIQQRIMVGMSSLPLVLLVSTLASYVQFSDVAREFDTYQQRVMVATISRDVDRAFLDLRRHVREFALTGRAADADAASSSGGIAAARIADGVREIKNPDRRRLILRIRDLFTAYSAAAVRAIDMKRQIDALTHDVLDVKGALARQQFDILASALHQVGPTQAAAELAAHAGLASLMDLRLVTNKALGRHDPALEPRAIQAAQGLQATLAQLTALTGNAVQQQESVHRLGDSVGAYVAGSRQAFQLADQLGSLVNGTMLQQAVALADASRALIDSASAEETAIAQRTHAEIATTVRLLLGLAVGGLVVGQVAAQLIGRNLARPISRLSAAMRALAGGDLTVEIPARGRGDELGAMAEALASFHHSVAEEQRLRADAAHETELKQRRQDAVNEHVRAFGTAITGVMRQMLESADSMRGSAIDALTASERTHETAVTTATGAEQSARNLSAISSATEQMSVTIRDITGRMQQASRETEAAAGAAAQTDRKVAALTQAADRIGNVVGLITSIARQTNLLALNATIEAARAGDAGRGFAVVASEVKALARQTSDATDAIARDIGSIRDETAESVRSVAALIVAIGSVNQIAGSVREAVEQQAAATQDIAHSVQEVNTSTQEATAAMQEVSAMAQHGGAATRVGRDRAEAMIEVARSLENEVGHFLHALSSGDETDRRRYERLPGLGQAARVSCDGFEPAVAEIVDVSRGGTALRCDWDVRAGTSVAITLPGAARPFATRVVRSGRGQLALLFSQHPDALADIDRFLAAVERRQAA